MVNPFLAAIAGGLLLFNGAASPRKAEKKFESALKQAFPTAKIDVTIKGKRGFDVINGKFRSVRVEMRDFQIAAPTAPPAAVPANPLPAPAQPSAPPSTKPMLQFVTTPAAEDRGHVGHVEIALKNFSLGPMQVTSMDASFEEVTYDWKELKNGRAMAIESAGPGKLSLVLPAAGLETALKARLTSIQNPRLALQDGLLRITGTRAAPVVGTPLPVLFTGRPVARGNEIRLEDVSLSVGGAPMPGLVTRTLIGEINPVFSFDKEGKWPYQVNLTAAAARDDALALEAALVFRPAVKVPNGEAGKLR